MKKGRADKEHERVGLCPCVVVSGERIVCLSELKKGRADTEHERVGLCPCVVVSGEREGVCHSELK